MHFEKTEEGKLARFLCRSILLNAGIYASAFHSRYCYILFAKKQSTLLDQVDVSHVKEVISKETLCNKRD